VHLHRLRVENFRALREASLVLDESVTVLFGENDCGKSSLINALEACLGRNAPPGTFNFVPSDFHRGTPEGPPAGRIRIEVGLREEEPPSRSDVAWPLLRSSGLAGGDGRLDFLLVVNATLDPAGIVQTFFEFQGPRPLGADPAELLAEVRRVVPFLRIRSGILSPAPALKAEPLPEKAARQEVEWAVRQAWSEFLEDPDRITPGHLARAQGALDEVLDQLEERLVPGPQSGLERRIAAPLSPSGSWRRIAGLLRGAGARSLAMLAFAGAFLQARGPEALGEDCHPVISVEDPEVHLHPLMLNSLWGLIDRIPAQKILTTNCPDLLSAIPLRSLRRMVRSRRGRARLFHVPRGAMSLDEMRRIAYHLRVRRGSALFMRYWLLVEGETEFWLLPEAARALDLDLLAEGVDFLEFAQCGLDSLATLANHLGIGWHLLADGDAAGQAYAERARPLARQGWGAVSVLRARDVEQCFWDGGYEHVFRQAAGLGPRPRRKERPRDVIRLAVKRLSKPGLALVLGQAMTSPGAPGVPEELERLLREAVLVARCGLAMSPD
jgi:putative ATP-dependent endonuclease of OLD family